MKYCKKCILPDTRPGIIIDEAGICSGCRGHEAKETLIDWDSRKTEFEKLVRRSKELSKGYDVLVPVSGGKDSWFQVIKAQEYGLKVLAYTWKTPGRTQIGQKNIDMLVEKLDVDHLEFSIAPSSEKLFTKVAFEELGISGIPMHMAIFMSSVRMAVQLDIPLILWGENPQLEYGGTLDEQLGVTLDEKWLSQHGTLVGTNPDYWEGHGGLTREDLIGYRLPTKTDSNTFSAFLGAYFKWNSFENTRIAQEHGFEYELSDRKTGSWEFADIDCNFISIHHVLKWYKFGSTRAFDNLSVQIRYGMITREEAIEKAEQLGPQIPTEDIKIFCDYLGESTDWFWDVCEKFRNTDIWEKVNGKWMVKDFMFENWKW